MPDDIQIAGTRPSHVPPDAPDGGGPAKIREFWESLSETGREHHFARYSGWVGPAAGIPVVDRDRANRAVLRRKHEYLSTEVARLKAELTGPDDDRRARPELDRLAGMLTGVEFVKQALTEGDASRSPTDKHYLLMLSSRGNGKVIISRGNPDTADCVATFVPGTGTKLAKARSEMHRSMRMVQGARKADAGKAHAVVTYLGYRTPDRPWDGWRDDLAADAIVDLSRHLEALRVTHAGPPSLNTVVGYSYGGLVVCLTGKRRGLHSDQVVLVAIPGPGHEVQHARDLGVDPDDVYYTTAANDWIRHWVSAMFHGPQPVHNPGFGGHEFRSDPATEKNQNAAHGAYWDYRNEAVYNFGRIIAGRADLLTCTPR